MNAKPTLIVLIEVLLHNGVATSLRLLDNARIEIWLGDEHGVRGCAVFDAAQLDEAAQWLLERAESAYPDSHFARVRALLRAYTSQCLAMDGKSHRRA